MTLPWTPTKGAKTKRLAEARLKQLVYHAAHEDDFWLEEARREIPDAWTVLEMDIDTCEPKDKVTLYLDRSVARMFRSMGTGYQARINRILATWVQMKIAGNVRLEMDMLERIAQDRADLVRSDDASALGRERARLHEHWAYVQGQMDAG